MPDIQDTPKAKLSSRTLRIVLFVSLALNLLILGAVAGAFLSGARGPAGAIPSAALVRDLGLGPYLRSLDQEDRRALQATARAEQGRIVAARREMLSTFKETLVVLRADTLDTARLTALIQVQAEVAERGRALGQQLLVARIETMSLEQRRMLADRLEVAVSKRRRHKKPKGADRQ